MSTRTIEYMRVNDLVAAPRNPKQHDLDTLRKSMARFGYVEPATIDERTGKLVAGHGRTETLVLGQLNGLDPPDGVVIDDEGHWLAPVNRGWASQDDAEAEGYVLASNQTTIAAGWDLEELATIVASMDNTIGLGFSDGEVEMMKSLFDEPVQEPEPDDSIPDVPSEPVTQPGDVWEIGPHRLICGDVRDPEVLAKIMRDQRATIAFTSPPYADRRVYDESSGFKPIPPEEYCDWFEAVQANVAAHLTDDGSWFVNINAGCEGLDKETYCLDLVLAHVRQWGWHWVDEYCWERVGVPRSVSRRFKNAWESVHHFAKGEFVFNPDDVRHYSDSVPQALGPGAGNTRWVAGEPGNGGALRSKRTGTVVRSKDGYPMGTSDEWAGGRHRGAAYDQWRGRKKAARNNIMQGAPQGVGVDEHLKRRKNGQRGGHPSDENEQGVGAEQMAPGEFIGAGLAYPSNRLPSFSGSHEATGHSAAFPVGLPEFFTRAYSDEGDVVLDPFCGSGSTLLAADLGGRIGVGVEVSPGYCDVIVERLQRRLGVDAIRFPA